MFGKYKARLLAILLTLILFNPEVVYAASNNTGTKPVLRIGVSYKDGHSGNRMLAGINDAVDGFKDNSHYDIIIEPLPYLTDEKGIKGLTQLILSEEKDSVDLILGPSDSGVFIALDEISDLIEKKRLIIISPLATANIINDKKTWLFRTNVDVSVRAQKISDFLAKKGFNTIAVVYADNGFGDRAEEAFREQFHDGIEENYLPLRYRNATEIRTAAKQILQFRPAAIGVFGDRHDIWIMRYEIGEAQRGWVKYDPLIFSIVDARTLCMQDVYFVSLAIAKEYKKEDKIKCNPSFSHGKIPDEVNGLAYDTTFHVLKIAEKIHGKPKDIQWRNKFRDTFAASLEKPGNTLGAKTSMSFHNMRNTAKPKIYTVRENILEKPVLTTVDEITATTVNPSGLPDWLDVRKRRFGFTPLINLLLVVAIVAILTTSDIQKGYVGSTWSFIRRKPFLMLLFFNIIIASITLYLLAEGGHVRWDNSLAAIGIAFGYTALLKTNFLETKTGQAFGLANIYDAVLKSINKKLMVLKSEIVTPKINYIAYTNSLHWLKQRLELIYKQSEDSQLSSDLMQKIEDKIMGEQDIDQRKICAEKILDLMNWRQIVLAGIVPANIKRNGVFDPEVILREASEYSNRFPEKKQRIHELVNQTINSEGPIRAQELQNELEEKLSRTTSERARLYVKLEWLLVRHSMNLRQFYTLGLLDNKRRNAIYKVIHRCFGGADDDIGELQQHIKPDRRMDPRIELKSNSRLSFDGLNDLHAEVIDVSLGGACVWVAKTLLTKEDNLENIQLTELPKPFNQVKLIGKCKAHQIKNDGTMIHLAWNKLSTDAQRAIDEFIVSY